MEDALVPFVVVLAVALGFGSLIFTFSRSRRILERWAAENGLQILSSQYRIFRRGSFFWTTSKSQTVYHVVVRTPDGRTRSGLVRCGSFWWGIFSDKAEVRWDA
jgi:hypothetical protein